jgi:RHS repeat-associated protein
VLDYDSDSNTSEVTRSFYHRNALGSVMDITAMDQVVEVSYRYAPYGVPAISRNSQPQSTDPLGQPWGYTARFQDGETGFLDYRARQYSPIYGRFLQRDPFGYAEGPALYQYVGGSPVNFTDPSGCQNPADSYSNSGTLAEKVQAADNALKRDIEWGGATVVGVVAYECGMYALRKVALKAATKVVLAATGAGLAVCVFIEICEWML